MTVRVEPLGVAIDVDPEESLMKAVTRSGYRWPSVCGGLAECGTCVVEILEAPPRLLTPGSDLEAQRLQTVPERRLHPEAVFRLACQFQPGSAHVVVRKRDCTSWGPST
jgi:2Fe-2S ferredoxin